MRFRRLRTWWISKTRSHESIYRVLAGLDRSRARLASEGKSSAHLDELEKVYSAALMRQSRKGVKAVARAARMQREKDRAIKSFPHAKPTLKKIGEDKIKEKKGEE